ncbi:glutathione S-transferase 1-1-like [Zootermopsis nevadensis]|uniref:Glutathione S-transferase 1-1 n=1 Tax=Zootermopsis nevadensis TaxID=136037 RepID=A0A067RAS4_ZOONE|nr:glutathione S-transferase 1-1-like [Zootermopsis nevadensis]KDR20966.1 Glutathione S-transferase 1-1 [Zootermopsis nevadensis]
MTIDFYYVNASAPCRSVLLLAKALKIELNLKVTDLSKGDNKTPEFLKLNPQHAIPTIDDNGLGIGESRAILAYLVNQYGEDDDALYPKDPKKRAIVDQRLYFDIGTLYQGFLNYYLFPIISTGTHGDKAGLEKLEGAFHILDAFLEKQNWVAGKNITIADYSIIASVSSIEGFGFDVNKYSNVAKWYTRAQKTIDGYKEINEEGVIQLKQFFKKFQK